MNDQSSVSTYCVGPGGEHREAVGEVLARRQVLRLALPTSAEPSSEDRHGYGFGSLSGGNGCGFSATCSEADL